MGLNGIETSRITYMTDDGKNYHSSTNETIEVGHINRGWDLTLFGLVAIVTSLSAISCITSLTFTLGTIKFSVVSSLIRLYGVCLAAAIVAVEAEIAASDEMRNFFVFQSWFYRGMFYIFVGLLFIIEHSTINEALILFVNVSAICLIASGLVYVTMGLLCLKPIKDRKMARYIQLLSQAEIQRAIKDPDDAIQIR